MEQRLWPEVDAIGSGGMTSSRIGFKGEGTRRRALRQSSWKPACSSIPVRWHRQRHPHPTTQACRAAQTSNGSQIFSRQIYAGLQNRFGTLTAGRQYAGSYRSSVISAAMGAGFFGSSAGKLLPLIGGMPTQLNNSLVYASQKVITSQLTLTAQRKQREQVTPTAAGSTAMTTDKPAAAAIWRCTTPVVAERHLHHLEPG